MNVSLSSTSGGAVPGSIAPSHAPGSAVPDGALSQGDTIALAAAGTGAAILGVAAVFSLRKSPADKIAKKPPVTHQEAANDTSATHGRQLSHPVSKNARPAVATAQTPGGVQSPPHTAPPQAPSIINAPGHVAEPAGSPNANAVQESSNSVPLHDRAVDPAFIRAAENDAATRAGGPIDNDFNVTKGVLAERNYSGHECAKNAINAVLSRHRNSRYFTFENFTAVRGAVQAHLNARDDLGDCSFSDHYAGPAEVHGMLQSRFEDDLNFDHFEQSVVRRDPVTDLVIEHRTRDDSGNNIRTVIPGGETTQWLPYFLTELYKDCDVLALRNDHWTAFSSLPSGGVRQVNGTRVIDTPNSTILHSLGFNEMQQAVDLPKAIILIPKHLKMRENPLSLPPEIRTPHLSR